MTQRVYSSGLVELGGTLHDIARINHDEVCKAALVCTALVVNVRSRHNCNTGYVGARAGGCGDTYEGQQALIGAAHTKNVLSVVKQHFIRVSAWVLEQYVAALDTVHHRAAPDTYKKVRLEAVYTLQHLHAGFDTGVALRIIVHQVRYTELVKH